MVTTREEAQEALAVLEQSADDLLERLAREKAAVVRARLAELEAENARFTRRGDRWCARAGRYKGNWLRARERVKELEAENQRLLDEMADKACQKCDGVNGVWAEGGAWVKCPRCRG